MSALPLPDWQQPESVKGGWLYRCAGMPTEQGCGAETIISRRYARVGVKKTGWLVCYGINDDGTEDRTIALVFCPECAAVVRGQE